MHLLVIEDERALCETIVRSLRRLAYSVDYCYDGEKALALLGLAQSVIIGIQTFSGQLFFKYLAHQGKSVGMYTGGSHANEYIASL